MCETLEIGCLMNSAPSTLSTVGHHASRSASPASSEESMTTDGFGMKSSASFASYDPLMADGLEEYSGRWPRAGMTRNGIAYRQPPLVPRTSATGSSLWPTPTASDGTGGPGNSGREGGLNLRTAVRWPTPTARDWKDGASIGKAPVNSLLGRAVGPSPESGSLNPTWVEWLMGFPIGWTDCAPSETP